MAAKTSKASLKEIEKLQKEIYRSKEKLTKLKQKLEPEEISDYELMIHGGKKIRLSELFGKKNDLIVVHNMGRRCPYCTTWADGFMGLQKHIEKRSAFVIISPDPPAEQKKFANSRGWKFKMISSKGSDFTHDMGFEPEPGLYWPGVSAFSRDKKGKLYRTGFATFGPGDDFCAIWPMFDLLKGGPGQWSPKFKYR